MLINKKILEFTNRNNITLSKAIFIKKFKFSFSSSVGNLGERSAATNLKLSDDPFSAEATAFKWFGVDTDKAMVSPIASWKP